MNFPWQFMVCNCWLITSVSLSGEKENYSEVYGKRLMQPNTCPMNGTRQDNCECVADAQHRQGFTAFNKVKVNVTSLKINSKEVC